jgi:hypothetical protein
MRMGWTSYRGESMSKMAKPCPQCGQYYPGDCYHVGCGDDKCKCDGCMIHFSIEEDED